jgi:hypothetical protein
MILVTGATGTNGRLEQLTGRPATTLARFAEDHAAAFHA